MSTDTDTVPITVKGSVQVTSMPTPPERVTVHSSFAAVALPVMILSHSPKRCRVTLTVCGLATDTAYLAASAPDAAQGGSGNRQLVQGGQVLFLTGSTEMWLVAGSGSSIVVGVAAEFEENDR